MQSLETRDLRDLFETHFHHSNHLIKFQKIEKGYENYPIHLANISKERIIKHSLQLDVFVKVLSSIFISEIDIANFSRVCVWFHYIANSQKLWRNKTIQRFSSEIPKLYEVDNWKLFYVEAFLISKFFFSNWYETRMEEGEGKSKETLYFSYMKKNTKSMIKNSDKLSGTHDKSFDLKQKDFSHVFTKYQKAFFESEQSSQEMKKRPLACCTFLIDQSGNNINANTVLHAFFRISEYNIQRNVSKIEMFIYRKHKYNWGGLFHKPHSHTPILFNPPLSVSASVLIKRTKQKILLIKIDDYDYVFHPKKSDIQQKDL